MKYLIILFCFFLTIRASETTKPASFLIGLSESGYACPQCALNITDIAHMNEKTETVKILYSGGIFHTNKYALCLCLNEDDKKLFIATSIYLGAICLEHVDFSTIIEEQLRRSPDSL